MKILAAKYEDDSVLRGRDSNPTCEEEFDCEEETGRLIDASLYLRNMLMGGVVDSMSNMKNEPTSIQPLTTEQLLFKIACYKK